MVIRTHCRLIFLAALVGFLFTEATLATPPDSEPTTVHAGRVLDVRTVVEGARHTVEHEDTTYYFCCGGCVAAFSSEPVKYLDSAPAAPT